MFIHSFVLGPMNTNCYVLSQDGQAVAIDAGMNPKPMIEYIDKFNLTLTHILLTHLHIDHIHGTRQLAEATRAEIYANVQDDYLLDLDIGGKGGLGFPPVPRFSYRNLKPGKIILMGHPCIVLDTPGHTPGSLSFHFPMAATVFTGDLIFKGSVGKTAFAGGDEQTLFKSIRERIFILPDDTEIMSGHGVETTVGEEKENNPFFTGPNAHNQTVTTP